MLILHPKVQKLIQKQLKYTDADIANLVIRYQFTLLNLLFDEILLYIEKTDLKDREDSIINKIHTLKAMEQGDTKILEGIYHEILETAELYPDLQKHIDQQISELNAALDHEIVEALNDEGKNELLDIIAEDLAEIAKSEKIADKLLANQPAN
jgi:hypothetical protein